VTTQGSQRAVGRLRSSRRRAAFEQARPLRVDLAHPKGTTLELIPLLAGGDAFGVVEIVGPTRTLTRREGTISSIVDQLAVVLRNAAARTEIERSAVRSSVVLDLAAELLGAATATEAVRTVVDAFHEHLGAPAVGLLPDRDGVGWFLASARGFGSRKRAEMRRAFHALPPMTGSPRSNETALRRTLAAVLRTDDLHPVVAADASVWLVGTQWQDDELVSAAGGLLSRALPHVTSPRAVASREADLAIACLAHELKGPITAAAAAISHVTEGAPNGNGELLGRTHEELRQAAGLIDPLLRWSSGRAPLHLRMDDLVAVVRDAIASCTLNVDAHRVRVEAPTRLDARIDPTQMRVAIANLIRNALQYSPPGSEVKVIVANWEGTATVTVRDDGPGVPRSERQTIFDPLVRGRSGHSTRSGSGLGLFLTRRIVEAHRGRVVTKPVRKGASFSIRLPSSDEGRRRSTS
jgi:signal transduction histidine kinase